MSSLNQCNFIGRLGKDPEVRFTQSGDAVANISLAVSETWKDKQGQKQERTEWVRCTAFKRQAEIIGEYLRKGSLIHVTGKLTTRKWQNQAGEDQYSTEINIQNMTMLSSKGESSELQQANRDPQQGTQGQHASQPAPQGQQEQVTKVDNSFDNFDDDIPF